jgi:hypothetical protein
LKSRTNTTGNASRVDHHHLACADWHAIWPSATCATALAERGVHHADIPKTTARATACASRGPTPRSKIPDARRYPSEQTLLDISA